MPENSNTPLEGVLILDILAHPKGYGKKVGINSQYHIYNKKNCQNRRSLSA